MREEVLVSMWPEAYSVCQGWPNWELETVITGEVEIPQKVSEQAEDWIGKVRAREDGKRSDTEINKTNDQVESL